MHVKKEFTKPTTVKLSIDAETGELSSIKQTVLKNLSKTGVKLQGFRSGKAPLSMVEKQLDPNLLQSEFLETAVNDLYVRALQEQNVRPVAQPEIAITKFVPFTTLEFTAELEAIGLIKLSDLKKIKL